MKKIFAILLVVSAAVSCSSWYQVPVEDDGDQAVNVGYNKVRKKDLTSAVGQVKIDQTIDGYSNIYEYLQGRVAGVDVQGTTIRVRGVRSLNGSNDPLLIVDGQPVDNLDNIIPNQVKSVEVLKDAAASAVYGSRGANGVILITLKKATDI